MSRKGGRKKSVKEGRHGFRKEKGMYEGTKECKNEGPYKGKTKPVKEGVQDGEKETWKEENI